MDPIEAFAVEALAYERWLLDGTDQDAVSARECLLRLLGLYRAGLSLPCARPSELNHASEVEQLGEQGWRKAFEASKRLPLDIYSEVFNPTAVHPGDQPSVGSICDDLADVYGDVWAGLRAFERGDRAAALWQWSFGLHSHWGAHATSAIRALHWWLRENASDALSVERT